MTSPSDDAAAFQAGFSDYKFVKTRGVGQFIFEVPQNDVLRILGILGGMPNAASEVQVAIARIQESSLRTGESENDY